LAAIFAAYFMMLGLGNLKFIDRMAGMNQNGMPATRAGREVAGAYIAIFVDSPRPYIREKVSEIEDLVGRPLINLAPPAAQESAYSGGTLVVAREFYPSELLKLWAESVADMWTPPGPP
jgi:phosphotransferase system enzyme I (PtsP)